MSLKYVSLLFYTGEPGRKFTGQLVKVPFFVLNTTFVTRSVVAINLLSISKNLAPFKRYNRIYFPLKGIWE